MSELSDDVLLRSLEDWRRRLIDLSHRNRLIAYRDTIASTLRIVAPAIHELLPDVDAGGKWEFFFPPEQPDETVAGVSEAAVTVDSAMLHSRPRQPRRQLSEIEFSERNPQRLARSLDLLAKRSNAEFHDKALRVLYIAVGFLDWHDVRSNKDISSPLVLIPVELRRDAAREPYRLVFVDDEEIVINPSLTEKLRRESDFELPTDWSWDDRSIPEELDDIRRAVTPRGWSVRDDAVLSLFSFQKYVMYRDLLDNEGRIIRNPIVRSLAHGRLGEELRSEQPSAVPPDELDDLQPPEKTLSILDADASQRMCVEAMKQGESFVIQGPPGTGKSQTIANIIAEALGLGKRVLFVSEKAAALDVVHNRLAAVGLDDYCLKLHGEHAVRREVVQALDRSLTTSRRAKSSMRRDEMDQLALLRKVLNNMALLLHLPQELLAGRSIREVYEELAGLHSVPLVPGAPEARALAGDAVAEEEQTLVDIFERLAERWPVSVREFAWRGYHSDRFNVDDRARVLSALSVLLEAVQGLTAASEQVANDLVVPAPVSLSEARGLASLAELLVAPAHLEPRWLALAPGELHSVVEDAEESYRQLVGSSQRFAQEFGLRSPGDVSEGAVDALEHACKRVRAECGWASAWEQDLAALPDAVSALNELPALIAGAEQRGAEAAELLGQAPGPFGSSRLESLAALCELTYLAEHRPEPGWLLRAGALRARTVIGDLEADLRRYQKQYAELAQRYKPEIVEQDLTAVRERFASDYASRWSRMKAPYRRDVRAVKALRQDGRLPESLIEDLDLAADTRALGERIDAAQTRMAEALGSYARGRETDADGVLAAVATAERALSLSGPGSDAGRLASVLSTQAERDTATAALAERLTDSTQAYLRGVAAVTSFVHPPLDSEANLDELARNVERITPAIRNLAAVIQEVDRDASEPAAGIEVVRQRAALTRDLARARGKTVVGASVWSRTIGPQFAAEETPWDTLRDSSAWLERAHELLGADSTEWLTSHLPSVALEPPAAEALRRDEQAVARAIEQVTSFFDPGRASELLELWESGSLRDIERLCNQLVKQVDDLHDWTQWRIACNRAVELGWGTFVDSLIEARVQGSDVVAAFERAFWNRRVEALAASNEEIAEELRRAAFQRWVDEFRGLDRKLVETGADRLVTQLEKQRKPYIQAPGSEVDLLRREARKQRRLMSVRGLISRIPTLLSDLKPCMMMSPLSVSHFLSAEHTFDLVLFDEASQVPPQDAINCVYRGRQLIVAGDSRQLPPTPFFQIAEEDPGTTVEDLRGEEDMESVLDACDALLPSHPLRWHYRSRSEALIAFSNSRVYSGGLVTFPAADEQSPTRGVSFIHTPDAVYDRGGTKTNRREAQAVAHRVMSHLNDGRGSVGVIAFNAAQAQAISEELDLLRLEHPELDDYFRGNRLDSVFVKHLEAVQGDERDVIVLSVGYGRDADGRFTMNFGPLNLEGGHRRLNVAITRAREQLEVVASVRAPDFRLGESASLGAQLLRDYLAYAEQHGRQPTGTPGADDGRRFDSPFEEQVAAAITDLGYEPVPDVGVGGFRIPIGVRSQSDQSRFVLAIETDGDAYVQTPTARDRERLRHEVLASLGWGEVHRIWSLDWVQNRRSEVNRLRDALQESEARRPDERRQRRSARRSDEREPVKRVARAVYDLSDPAAARALPWTRTYERAALARPEGARDFNSASNRQLQMQMIIELVRVEAPLSIRYAARRLAEMWNLSRVGRRTESVVQEAIQLASDTGKVEIRDMFLWRPGQTVSQVRVPDPDVPASRREPEDIPPEELDLAIARIREVSPGIEPDQLALQVARVFGFDRAGTQMRALTDDRMAAAAASAG